MGSISIAEKIASKRWVGSKSYNSYRSNRLPCCIIVTGSLPPVLEFSVVTYSFRLIGEVLLFFASENPWDSKGWVYEIDSI